MEFCKLKLISIEESKELFFVQNKLIRKIETKDNTVSNVLRLAILQTLPPIGDYECAQKILEDAFNDYKDFSLCIIGSYLCSKWCFDIFEDKYLNFLIENYHKYSDRDKAIVEFLIALNLLKNDCCTKEITEHLEKSVALCDEFKNNKILLNNLKNINCDLHEDSFYNLNIEESIDPHNFISEFIK